MRTLLCLAVLLPLALSLRTISSFKTAKSQVSFQGPSHDPQIVGGFTPLETKNLGKNEQDQYNKALQVGIQGLKKDGVLSSEKVTVKSVEVQTVAGLNYKFHLLIDTDNGTQEYDVIVFVQPWTQTYEYLRYETHS